jgi:Ca2+-binding EF-hand superfamily protein
MSVSGLGGASYGARPFQPPKFGKLDTNGDNSVSLDELKAGAPGGATAASDQRAEALFKAMDTDGNGGITEDEKNAFDQMVHDRRAGIAFLAQQFGGSTGADVFKAADTDGNGAISLDELSGSDAAKGLDSDALQKVFGMIDTNGDGSISQDESSVFLSNLQQTTGIGSAPPSGDDPSQIGLGAGSGNTADLMSLAQNAYAKSSSSSGLMSTLEGLLTAA